MEESSSISNTLRYKQVQAQAVHEVNNQVKHWENVKSDYNNLLSLLTTLPDKTVHNVMVPFGSLALMPGKLIHTNELMVHLGDSWFADVTCKQGIKIIDHRLKTVNKNLEDLDKVLKNIEKKSNFTAELDNSGNQPAFEIKEEVPSSYVHPSRRKRISRVKSKTKPTSETTGRNDDASVSRLQSASQSCYNDEALMRRLDELEKQEEEEDEMFLSESIDVDKKQSKAKSTASVKKEVSWNKKLIEGREADSDDSDDASTAVIRFLHTPTPVRNVSPLSVDDADQRTSEITCPGDIGRIKPNTSLPNNQNSGDGNCSKGESSSTKRKNIGKSILKKSTAPLGEDVKDTNVKQFSLSNIHSAVSENVVERAQLNTKVVDKSASKRPVSKFKASRQR